MKTRRQVLIAGLAALLFGGGMVLQAQDAGTEMGVADDLTVRGRQGTKSDPDLEVHGYSAFGTNYAGALVATSGVGNVFIQNRLEVGAGVVYPDGTAQATAYNTNAVFTLASGECDTNRVDILFSVNYLVSRVTVFQSPVTDQGVSVFRNGSSVTTFPFTGASTSQTLSVSIDSSDRLGILCTNVNGTILFAFEGRRR
jgi:hypothetical protein